MGLLRVSRIRTGADRRGRHKSLQMGMFRKMYRLTGADKIWNRACEGGGDSPNSGDHALSAVLLFHGPAMNGGVIHAVQCLSSVQLLSAQAAFRYFGLIAAAELISKAERFINEVAESETVESMLNQEYWQIIPDDEVLVKSFESHLRQHPSEYSPLIE